VNAVEASERSEPLPGKCRDWRALQPPGVGKLMVRGWCTFPSSGWRMELRRKEPQGSNPGDLLLERVVDHKEGHPAGIVKAIEVEYEEETETPFDTVTILPDGPTIEVEKGA